ncbi:hypothetical protein C8F04DRAFT_974391 [Mycena alexandri]|uniref:Uncharacterized protein n=1 Tax=Mycena alexandri TaxID=1745969 RepID=A0AAD6WTG9_9AGAR|nr:hypothetical protein C8F04DRAFT_974391 [Mycena alexandri]
MKTQAMFVPAIAAIHNFLRVHDTEDNADDLGPSTSTPLQREGSRRMEDFIETPAKPREISPEELGFSISAEERKRASDRRDRIAKKMWSDYVALLAERGEGED